MVICNYKHFLTSIELILRKCITAMYFIIPPNGKSNLCHFPIKCLKRQITLTLSRKSEKKLYTKDVRALLTLIQRKNISPTFIS